MADNARGIHVSPGVYSKETDITYAVKSLGITTLGMAGETLRGPAFQPMHIENWREFVDVFGGTSTEKFKGSQYPKYELPYIAKSYLTESRQLEVVRVLGLSGYKAGPAWIVTASKSGDTSNKKYVVAVLRSRAHYEYYYNSLNNDDSNCECQNQQYDRLVFDVGEILPTNEESCKILQYNDALAIAQYIPMNGISECEGNRITSGTGVWNVSSTNNGKFKIMGLKGAQNKGAAIDPSNDGYFEYSVSLNPFDKDFILKVLGSTPNDGDAPIYVESLYEEALHWMIESAQVDQIDSGLTFYQAYNTSDYNGLKAINGIISEPEDSISRKDLGKRFLIDETFSGTVHPYDYKTGRPVLVSSGDTADTKIPLGDGQFAEKEEVKSDMVGQIVTVKLITDADGKRHYIYAYYRDGMSEVTDITIIDKLVVPTETTDQLVTKRTLVKNNTDGLFYRLATGDTGNRVIFVTCDLNNYSEAYRFASTPWIVSNLKGDYKNVELNKLFRFHTISDGSNCNFEVKVSIENILPDEGSFDVLIRAAGDSDESPVVLEKYSRVNLTPGNKNYISFRIGSYDGIYEAKSKYVTVEVNENITTENSIPAGFLGYPRPDYGGNLVGQDPNTNSGVTFPNISYNCNYDNAVKNRKQYFGLSNRSGIDFDMFTYKGVNAYINDYHYTTRGFHLDSRLDLNSYDPEQGPAIYVDGELYDLQDGGKRIGYFECVSPNNRTETLSEMPIIGSEDEMRGSIYEYKNLRKFTVYFYGGFDGWDWFRDQRSNTDDFKLSNYRGVYDKASGEGLSVNKIFNPDVLQLNQESITSDWYAYLAGYRQFANPESIDINVFASPGIDYVNNQTLVEEVIEMLEEERADSIYVVTTPDKPSGASDFVDEMYTPEEAVDNLDVTEIDSNYTCTYYPWVKYFDQDNSQYIYLPPTKDAVRNFAQTDNQAFPWFAPAGVERGNVNCVRAHYITKLADEDVLYEGRINPVKTFAQDGPKLWGQKNLQIRESQLNRIAVRRLLLRMRKLVAIACRSLIFQPNDPTAKDMFLTAVTPILDNIRANRGISDYRIEVDDSIEARDRRELPAKIFFKAYNALEYIVLDFILTPEGLSFDNI